MDMFGEKLTAQMVKEAAKSFGADLCGITSMDRFEGAPKEQDPRYIFPEAKSMLVLAFRLPRGYFRGIEEGTYFAPYASMGYGNTNQVYGPVVLRDLCCFIEDFGWEAVPVPNIYLGANIAFHTQQPGNGSFPVREGQPAPDVCVDYRIAAFAAGMGQIGYSKVFLTPEFGPMQRFVALLTDAELEPDPIYEGQLCDRCMSCARACAAKAISTTETVSITVAGHKCEWGKLDVKACSHGYMGGATYEYNPFFKHDGRLEDIPDTYHGIVLDNLKETSSSPYGQLPTGTGVLADMSNYGGHLGHNPTLEGARGCMRECYIHLEKKGVLTRKFHNQFRKRPAWRITPEMREEYIKKCQADRGATAADIGFHE